MVKKYPAESNIPSLIQALIAASDGVVFSGEDYAAGGERVCLLEYGGALARNGVGVGDVVEIAGNAYRVKGIVLY